MVFSKYLDFIKGKQWNILNLQTGALISLNNETYKKLKNAVRDGDTSCLSDNEIGMLQEQGFLVSEIDNEISQEMKPFAYHMAKYNNSQTRLKIDFALTDRCNFNCPYCFEKDNLCKRGYNSKELFYTGEKIIDYISKLCEKKTIEHVEIVFYGGEPTLEKDFLKFFINKVSDLESRYGFTFTYLFITNGFLIDTNFISMINPKKCRYVQVTIDGTKEFHNQRRTNFAKINTFDKIIKNICLLLQNGIHVVIRLNVDKSNFDSVYKFIKELPSLISTVYYGNLLGVDVARVFGGAESYDLVEYEKYRMVLIDELNRLGLVSPRTQCKELSTFCVAECVTNDIVIDHKGLIYRCWNNVFDDKCKILTIDDLLKNSLNPVESSKITLDYVSKYSLDNVNGGKCFKCKYVNYCQGLCPAVRKKIDLGEEKNIYLNGQCKKIIKDRLKQIVMQIEERN